MNTNRFNNLIESLKEFDVKWSVQSGDHIPETVLIEFIFDDFKTVDKCEKIITFSGYSVIDIDIDTDMDIVYLEELCFYKKLCKLKFIEKR